MGIGGLAQIVWRSSFSRIFLQIEMTISRSYAIGRPFRVVGPDRFDEDLLLDMFDTFFVVRYTSARAASLLVEPGLGGSQHIGDCQIRAHLRVLV
jgi:hypothetical protein